MSFEISYVNTAGKCFKKRPNPLKITKTMHKHGSLCYYHPDALDH